MPCPVAISRSPFSTLGRDAMVLLPVPRNKPAGARLVLVGGGGVMSWRFSVKGRQP